MITPYTHSNILPLFEYLAEWTWDLLGSARQLRLRISEDTITDMTAFEIARAGLRGIKIARVTKQEEALYGFDWMWLIGNRVQGYEPYVVQAKKIRIENGGKSSYNIRHRTGSVHQIAVLETLLILLARYHSIASITTWIRQSPSGIGIVPNRQMFARWDAHSFPLMQ